MVWRDACGWNQLHLWWTFQQNTFHIHRRGSKTFKDNDVLLGKFCQNRVNGLFICNFEYYVYHDVHSKSTVYSIEQLLFFRNPNIFSNGSWARVYWPLHTSRGKEYLELSTKNMTQRKGHRSRKCAFWNSYLPNLIGMIFFNYMIHLMNIIIYT